MKQGLLILGLMALITAAAAVPAQAGERWYLDCQPVKMDRILVKIGGAATPYWYMIYKIKNPTEEEVTLNLSIRGLSDVGKKTYLEWYNPEAVKAIQAREGRSFKSVQDMRTAIGPGETIEAVALFRKPHEGTDLFRVTVTGLWDRVYHEKGRPVVEDRALNLYFKKSGDEYYPQFDRFVFSRKEEVVL
jgi:hypothetical protein